MEQPKLLEEPETDINETVGRLLKIMARHRWWVLLPTVVAVFATLLVLSRIPNRYSSEATLLVVQQQVPQRYVLPTTTTDIREGLQATTQEVLSRTRLLQIIEEFSLYSKERRRLSPEGLLEVMRSDIGIQPIESPSPPKDVSSFKISFIADNPQLAQGVTSKLTSLFIEQNLVTREHQASTTTNFLQEQLEATRKKLTEAEEQVRSFKMQNLGALPEQQQGNLTILGGLQAQLQSTMSSLSRARERLEYLRSLNGYRAQMVESDLDRLKSERATLLVRYTSQYPAVRKANEKISQTEALLRTLRASPVARNEKVQDEAPLTSFGADQDPSIALQLKSQLESNRLEIENLTKEEKQLKAAVEQYQKRLNQTPVREQQLTGVLRNYDQLKQDYVDLLNKESQSRMAADLEKRQEGQQFRMVDQPSLPTVPSSPDRVKINLVGAGGGVLLGLVLAFLVDSKDHSFRSEKDLGQRFPLPLVVGVPLLFTSTERRVLTWKRTFECLGGACLLLAVFAAELYEFYLYRHS
jgi:polysaccharide chain length determinant protein (PEP-CTERM system associated)